jgi:excisionase family DNA binding protein
MTYTNTERARIAAKARWSKARAEAPKPKPGRTVTRSTHQPVTGTFMTTKQAADYYGVHTTTMVRLCHDKVVKHVKFGKAFLIVCDASTPPRPIELKPRVIANLHHRGGPRGTSDAARVASARDAHMLMATMETHAAKLRDILHRLESFGRLADDVHNLMVRVSHIERLAREGRIPAGNVPTDTADLMG